MRVESIETSSNEIEIYFDESKSKDPEIFIISGILAFANEWRSLENRWLGFLKSSRLYRDNTIYPFHMTDFENRQGLFNGWPNNERIEFISGLLDCINQSKPIRFSASIIVSDIKFAVEKNKTFYSNKFAKKLLYHLCFSQIIFDVATIQPWAPGKLRFPPIKLVCDQNRDISGQLTDVWREQTKKSPFLAAAFTPPIFSPRDTSPPLQAADIIVYEEMKETLNNLIGCPRPRRKSYERLEGKYGRHIHITRDNVCELVSAFHGQE